jgi:hypothetical protein
MSQADPITVSGAQVNERMRALALVCTQKVAEELQKTTWEPGRIDALAHLMAECANDYVGADEGQE